ncbi:MAG: T9SS type A sorting domain-containing protein [Bacteroidetes bacterium]|nr:T9SS type A sorting domain-containing protein [Bacteroidota bacterium]
MKTTSPVGRAIRRAGGTLIVLLLARGLAFPQATALMKFGNSYVNITKKAIGGPVEPGDVLEIRTNFYVNKAFNSTGMMYRVRYFDNLPTNTAIVAGSTLNLITNEGLVVNSYTQATTDDAGSFVQTPILSTDYQIRINMGGYGGLPPGVPSGADPMAITDYTGATNLKGGSSIPLFSSGSIITTAFRVTVTGNYGDTITLGAGKIVFKKSSNGSDQILSATQYQILISKPSSLCSTSTSTNFAAESGGTFDHGTTHDRSAGPSFPIPGYTYLNPSATTNSINDGYYAIVNNTSPTSSTYPDANRQPNCSASPSTGIYACSNREFGGFWFIGGDHTGTTTAAGNAPPAAGTDGGYMLLVNADLATSEAYHQVISGLCPNTYYQFSCWVKNVCPNCGIDMNSNPTYLPGVLPNLTLVVDGLDRISTGQLDTVGWQQRGFVLLTGPTQTSITISIRNNAPGGGGNDWALDDIALSTCPPDLLLTPNKPDTLCQGSDDTVRFKISSFVDNYTQWIMQKSTDNGATWVAAGLDTLGNADNGTSTPAKDPLTGLYTDIVTRYYRIAATDSKIIYRISIASTVANLTTNGCFYTTNQPKLVVGVDCMIVLPTTLLNFRGQVRNTLANLQWTSSDEVNGLTYTVQRSDDGKDFRSLVTVPGIAGDGRGATYSFIDPNPVTTQTYYRVVINGNSATRVSNLVLLSNSDIHLDVRSALNPFVDHISVEMTSPAEGRAVLSLSDMYGRYVRREQTQVNEGLNSMNVYGLNALPAGTYVLQIQVGDQVISKKLVKALK